MIPVAIWTISMLSWMIMGEIDPGSGMFAILVGLGLGITTIHPPEPYLSPVCFVAITSMVVFYPIVRSSLTKRAMIKIDLEHLERLHEQVRMNPTNTAAKFKIADMLYNRGYVSHAVAVAENLSEKMPKELYPEENRILNGWRSATRGRLTSRPLPCPNCGTYNPPGDIRCVQCGDDYLLRLAKGQWLRGFVGSQLLAGWLVAVVAIVGIPTVASLDLPRWMVVGLVVAMMAGGSVVLLRAFLKKEAT